MRVPVADLLGNPGSSRRWDKAVAPDELEGLVDALGETATVLGDVVLDLDLDAVVEGILVRGDVEVDLEVPCSRCLTPVRLEPTITVAEIYVDPRVDVEELDDEDLGYVVDDDLQHLDLSPLVRDAVAMELPVRLLCRPDCAGLCPVCGQDRNEADCGHRPEDDVDPRWAKLAQLDLG